jgi:hypothetical protein
MKTVNKLPIRENRAVKQAVSAYRPVVRAGCIPQANTIARTDHPAYRVVLPGRTRVIKININHRGVEVKVTNLELASRAANEHGRKDFWAGNPCDPSIPLKIYDSLTPEQQSIIMNSWVNGWNDGSVRYGMELQTEYEVLEEQIAELESQYISEHEIRSRDGYIPQSFDEIGNAELRAAAERDFARLHCELLSRFGELKIQLNQQRKSA